MYNTVMDEKLFVQPTLSVLKTQITLRYVDTRIAPIFQAWGCKHQNFNCRGYSRSNDNAAESQPLPIIS